MRPPPTPEAAAALLALQERFRDGDPDAFRQLVEPHLDSVYTLCLRMLGSPSLADDAAQDALARALTRHRLYRPGQPMRPWLLTIAANVCRNHLRSAWWRRWLPFSGGEVAEVTSADRLVEESERDQRVRTALASLDPIYREALSLYHIEDMSYAEMEAITGVSVNALKQRVRRGRMILAEKLGAMSPEDALRRTAEET